MSTKERYGSAVWAALIAINSSDDVMGGHSTYKTVATIADGAGVSKMTARKYLNELCESGHAHKIGQGRTVMYGEGKAWWL